MSISCEKKGIRFPVSLDKTDSRMLKGIAILVMIFHHFFGMYAVSVSPALRGLIAEDALFSFLHALSGYGKVCVAIFAFVTGYGYFVIAEKETQGLLRAVWCRLRSFLPLFILMVWLVYVLMSFFSCGAGFTWDMAVLQCVGVRNCIQNYWYISVVLVCAVVFFPLLLRGKRKGRVAQAVTFFCIVFFLALLRISYGLLSTVEDSTARYMVSVWGKCGLLDIVYTLPYFLLGYAFALLAGCSWRGKLIPLVMVAVSSGLCLFSWNFRFLAVVLIFAVLVRIRLLKKSLFGTCLACLGSYSAGMWLNHQLIFGYWFSDFFYRIPTPFNYAVVVLLSFILSVAITTAVSKLQQSTMSR